MKNRFKGFTLAEMMVVMLVLTIMLAAAAPIMTKRREVTATDSPWRYSTNGNDAYFGLGANQTAMIGQDTQTDKDIEARLIMTTDSTTKPFITFKKDNDAIASMFFNRSGSFFISGPFETGTSFDDFKQRRGNTAFGSQALSKNTEGEYNTAIGSYALNNNASGSDNIAIGSSSLDKNTVGKRNVAIGTEAMYNSTSPKSADFYNTDNVAIGYQSLLNIEGRTAMGGAAARNIAIGSYALYNANHMLDNIAIGYSTLKNGTGFENIAIGNYALETNTGGSGGGKGNIAIGLNSIKNNKGGFSNIGIGNNTLLNNSSGEANIAMGPGTMNTNESGSNNIAIGRGALSSNKTGSNNVAIGTHACENVQGSNKTCIGYNSGPKYNSTQADEDNSKKIIYLGDENTIVMIPGHLVVEKYALLGTSYNSSDTYSANGYYPTQMRMANSGSWAIYSRKYDFGHWSQISSNNWQFYPNDGTCDTQTFDDTVTIANCGGWYKDGGGNVTKPSDKRLKNITGENKAGLEEVKKLNVFNFTYKKDDKKTPHVGVIAQDLRKIFPDAVVEGEDGYLQIRHEDMFYAVVNAVKQLNTIVEALIAEVKVDLAKILKHDEDIAKLQKQNKEIVKQNKELRNKNEELEKRIDNLEKRLEKVLKELDED